MSCRDSLPCSSFYRLGGQNHGIIHYTVGQRKGLGVSSDAPLYVQKKSPEDNTVTLSRNEELFSGRLTANGLNLISCPSLAEPTRVTARIRYHQVEQPATVTQLSDDTVEVVFDRPQRAIAPGQAVVFYQGDTVLGGATITKAGEGSGSKEA